MLTIVLQIRLIGMEESIPHVILHRRKFVGFLGKHATTPPTLFELKSAVDDCCYNSPEYGDVYFYLPSAPIRDILGIVDSDGYLFFDNSRKVIAEHSIAGEKWRTYQNYVIVDRPVLFERLQRAGKRLVWIMRERRIRTGNAQEKFGEFGADRDKSYIGYFDGDKFTVREIHSEIWSSEPKKKSL